MLFFSFFYEDWQGAVNKQEEEEVEEELLGHNTVLVFVIIQRRCYRRRLDTPDGQSDFSPIHSVGCSSFFSLDEDFSKDFKKLGSFHQHFSKKYII